MTKWPVRKLWCWKCFKFTKHTGRIHILNVEGVGAPVTAQIQLTTLVCLECFNCKKTAAELDHMEMPAKTEEE